MEEIEIKVEPITAVALFQIFKEDWDTILRLILPKEIKIPKPKSEEKREYQIIDNCEPPYCPFKDEFVLYCQCEELIIELKASAGYNSSGHIQHLSTWSFSIKSDDVLQYDINITSKNGMVEKMRFRSCLNNYKELFDEVRHVRKQIELHSRYWLNNIR